MVLPFQEAGFALKNPGDIVAPVQTTFGYHIIKLIEKKPNRTCAEVKDEVKGKIERSPEYKTLRSDFVEKVKTKYPFTENSEAKKEMLAKRDSSFVKNTWLMSQAANMNKTRFSIGNRNFTQSDMASYLEINQRVSRDKNIEEKYNKLYTQALEQTLIEYDLSERNIDFKRLLQEYRDGLPLFAMLERKIWSNSNYCGNGTFSAARSFVTGTAGVFGAGQSRVVLFSDDVEAGTNGWTTAGTGGTAWTRQTAVAGTRLSTMVWRVPNNTVTSDRQLVSPAISVPAGATDVTLSYDTHHSFEIDGPTGCWDAGSLEVSTDGGANWAYLDDSRMFTDPYVGTSSDGAPLAGRGGWCHVTVQPFSFLTGFEDTAQVLPARNIVDLSGFAGQSIQLRFRATSDSNTAATAPNGGSIDNILVQRCQ